jgi:hypothetical protein
MDDRAKHREELLRRLSILEHDLPLAKEEKRIAVEVLANGEKSRKLPNRPNPTPSQFLARNQDQQKANEKYERLCAELSEVKEALVKLDNYGLQSPNGCREDPWQ